VGFHGQSRRQAIERADRNGALAIEVAEHPGAHHPGAPRNLIDGKTLSHPLAAEFSGHQLLAAAYVWQNSVYEALTAEWTDDERAAFERAMRRLVAKSPDLSSS
jgi:hypothetical protein